MVLLSLDLFEYDPSCLDLQGPGQCV